MPSAMEKLIKILRLEQQNNYSNRAVIGGLQAYAENWSAEAHQEAARPEQNALIEEIILVIADYDGNEDGKTRKQLAQYILDRLMQRAEPLPQYVVNLPEASPVMDMGERSEPTPEFGQRAKKDHQLPLKFSAPAKPATERPAPKPRRKKRPFVEPHKAQSALQALNAPLTTLPGVGEKMAEKLANLGAETVGQLLYLFPRRYDDYTRMLPLSKLEPYQTYTVVGTIRKIQARVMKGKRDLLVVTIDDGTRPMEISFFNQQWLRRQFKEGMQLVFSGKTDLFMGRVGMTNPAWEPIDQQSLHTAGIVPVYPLTKGISARTMRRMMKRVVDDWADKLPDYVPDSVLDRANQVDLSWALRQIHFPTKWEYVEYARERLAFDELLLLQLGVMASRSDWQAQPAQPLQIEDEWQAAFEGGLPFALTSAQLNAMQTIRADLAKAVPMNRLLQGDVGSGKTMVAAFTLAAALLNNKQAALMAPTSILAEQHYQKLSALFAELPAMQGRRVALLTGSLSESERREVYAGLADGSIHVVIGTHAVIQEGVAFADLAVVVVDEQHRFGVEQRGALRGKGTNPHVLVMTATPIPRTLALTLYADLDLSILDEMPPGRTPIQTKLLHPGYRLKAYEFVDEMVLQQGQQAYVIYPLVEASEALEEVESALEGYEFIRKEVYYKYRVGLVHGRMKPAEKDAVMGAFARGELDVLVATAVIEVGVDVPNATAIIIENAERFGLAQLHQFRGRVGRGTAKSYCLLITEEPTPRLEALESTTDGFKLAEMDWQQRGAGDLLGLRQSGHAGRRMHLAAYMNIALVELAQKESQAIYAEDPELAQPEYALLQQRIQIIKDTRSDLS